MTTVNKPSAVSEPVSVKPETQASVPAPKATKTRAKPKAKAKKPDGAVTLKAPDLIEEDAIATRTFWIGTMTGCKIEVIHVGGVAFPRKTGTPHFDEGTKTTTYTDEPGQVIDLSEAQVERIKADVLQKVIRPVGGRWRMLTRNGKTYRAQVGDIPAGRFLYMHDLSETGGRKPAAPRPMME